MILNQARWSPHRERLIFNQTLKKSHKYPKDALAFPNSVKALEAGDLPAKSSSYLKRLFWWDFQSMHLTDSPSTWPPGLSRIFYLKHLIALPSQHDKPNSNLHTSSFSHQSQLWLYGEHAFWFLPYHCWHFSPLSPLFRELLFALEGRAQTSSSAKPSLITPTVLHVLLLLIIKFQPCLFLRTCT